MRGLWRLGKLHSGGKVHGAGLISCVLQVALIEVWERLNHLEKSDILISFQQSNIKL